MPYDAGSVVLPAKGYIYFGVGTSSSTPVVKPTIPADPTTNPTVPAASWVVVGSTSADSPFTIARAQDDPTPLPTWANPSGIRVSSPAVSWSLEFGILEQSILALDLYYGSGGTAVDGSYKITSTSSGTASYGALYVHIVDAAHAGGKVGIYFPKVSIIGRDNLEMATDALNTMPVSAKVLGFGGDLFEFVDTSVDAP